MNSKTTTKPDYPDQLLTVADVARLDGVSEKTVRRAIAVGLLEVLRVGPTGRLLRIHPAALSAYRNATRR
jgi:excisionase family DNA binding protein